MGLDKGRGLKPDLPRTSTNRQAKEAADRERAKTRETRALTLCEASNLAPRLAKDRLAGRQPSYGGPRTHHPSRQPPLQSQPRFGVEHRVRLSTEPPVLMADGSREQQYLTTSLEQKDDDGVARVIIGHNMSAGVAATLNEARRFALDILALVDQQDVSS
jgi:hypothetical protein